MNVKAIPAMLSMIPSVIKGVESSDLEKIKRIVRATFPSVRQIDVKMLSEWLATSAAMPLLIDVRSPQEFAVSHLQGALNLRNVSEITSAIFERRPAMAVLYCSVGFRSSRIAHRLSNQTITEVFNLEGSIFEWVNQGCPVYLREAEVRQVHPYGPRWAGLLKADILTTTRGS